jgi:putative membrane protein
VSVSTAGTSIPGPPPPPDPAVPDPGEPGAAELTWRRFHPVTPFIKGWKVLLALLVVAFYQGSENLAAARELMSAMGALGVLAVVLVVGIIGTAFAAIAWRMTRYAIDAEGVYLKSGILFRQHRTARMDRIQAIDVVQPLLARILGLAELKIEVAGGGDSAVRMSFLREEQAQALRNELLARAAGIRLGQASPAPSGDTSPPGPVPGTVPAAIPVAPEREVFALTVPRLVASLVRSVAVIGSVLFVVVLVVMIVITRQPELFVGVFPALLAAVGFAWQRFAGEFGFRAAVSPDGIRLRHGLLESRSQTVPPGRVQAVRISQGPLWRGKDWWRVQMNVAGYATTNTQQVETVLLPVGDRSEALLALWLVLPDLGVSDPTAILDAALSGSGEAQGFVTSPRRARWLDPVIWRRTGFALTDRALLLRGGRFLRHLVVVPHERTQSLGISQGPLQRRLGLASFVVHSTPGPVHPVVPHLDAHAAGTLLAEQASRARSARAVAAPERWMAGGDRRGESGQVSPASE